MDFNRWIRNKKEVKELISEDIFARRPLDNRVLQYYANDVIYLPSLRDVYTARLNSQWMKKAIDESERHVNVTLSDTYKPQDETKLLGPWPGKKVQTRESLLEQLEEDMMERNASENVWDELGLWI